MMRATLAFRVLGSVDGRRDLVSYKKAVARYADADPVIHPEIPAFLSVFTFPDAMRRHVATTGSTRDYDGPVGVPALRWDIDSEDDPDAALNRASRDRLDDSPSSGRSRRRISSGVSAGSSASI